MFEIGRYVAIWTFMLLSALGSSSEVYLNRDGVTLSRQLVGSGFHREIKTTVTVSNGTRRALTDGKCRLLLLETLSPGVYADPFQLKSLEPFGGPKVAFSAEVDLEATADQSKPLEINIFIDIYSTDEKTPNEWTIGLPVHGRYHRPSLHKGASSVEVIILNPVLYSSCSFPGSSNPVLLAPCDASNNSKCKWNPILYQRTKKGLSVGLQCTQLCNKVLLKIIYTCLLEF
ncbi:phosphatidylinositol-glycan biosynthesis class X protein isoform X2 [Aplysia californica]|uniref:Phosphatidylinositol-glycan biosynthesis class X protein n=1 Tax=Aplysia californica TaxID=6500 RepID=A0ABM1VNW9_APLCA|nr:phosphatidylinositol-glycan biosynthesis class X protein isoform X2 [Aplysia californica]